MQRKSQTIFSRLLLYFTIVMIVPLLIMIITYFYYSEENIAKIISNQTEKAVERDAQNMSSLFSAYKHKAYMIAEDLDVKEVLSNDSLSQEAMKKIYSLLFSELGGDNSLAQASIVSISGKIQMSTHSFPEIYDPRIYNNEWDSSNILATAIAEDRLKSPSKTEISIANHRTDFSGQMVLATLIRRVYDDNGAIIGYVIIDIFSDILGSNINTSSIFQEELLVDTSSYMAISLLHPTHYGSYKTFPSLSNEDMITFEHPIAESPLAIIASTDIAPYKTNISSSMLYLLIAIVIGLVISVVLSLLFSHSFAKRAKILTDAMARVEKGELNPKSSQNTGLEEFDKLSKAFNEMTAQIEALIEVNREEEAKLAEAERKELEGQLNPHFLFNTLNTIKALARLHGEDEIYTISIRLGKILRSALNNRDSQCTIQESLDLVESYLLIQKIRFGEKISYSLSCDESLMQLKTPKLIIQPLVENAIIHGLEPKTEKGMVSVIVQDLGQDISITVEDDGMGFEDIVINNLPKAGHIGLYNVYRRLQLVYQEKLEFKVESEIGKGTRIYMRFPKDITHHHEAIDV